MAVKSYSVYLPMLSVVRPLHERPDTWLDIPDCLSIRGDGSYLVSIVIKGQKDNVDGKANSIIAYKPSFFNTSDTAYRVGHDTRVLIQSRVRQDDAFTRTPGFKDGSRADAVFGEVNSIVLLKDGVSFLFLDTHNRRVRECSFDGTVTTRAGDGTDGIVDGVAEAVHIVVVADVVVRADAFADVIDAGGDYVDVVAAAVDTRQLFANITAVLGAMHIM